MKRHFHSFNLCRVKWNLLFWFFVDSLSKIYSLNVFSLIIFDVQRKMPSKVNGKNVKTQQTVLQIKSCNLLVWWKFSIRTIHVTGNQKIYYIDIIYSGWKKKFAHLFDWCLFIFSFNVFYLLSLSSDRIFASRVNFGYYSF